MSMTVTVIDALPISRRVGSKIVWRPNNFINTASPDTDIAIVLEEGELSEIARVRHTTAHN